LPAILTITLNPAVDVSSEADIVRPTLKIRTRRQKHYPGGGGINVARVIVELGGSAEVVYLSGGASGALLDDCMERIGVTTHRVKIAQPTRIAYMVHEEKTGFEYRFVPEGPKVEPAEIEDAINHIERFDGEYIVASGSLPKGLPNDTYLKFAEIAQRKGARFILDTSGPALRAVLSSSTVFLFKPSLGELERFVGARLDEEGARQAALNIVKEGRVQNVAVSMGAQGALLANRDGIQRLPTMHVKVHSAVGAGDSFVGAMVHSLAGRNSIDAAFRFGIAAGAAAVMTAGSKLCRRDDVEALFRANSAERM
jgi:6-phosphofructokinase 2